MTTQILVILSEHPFGTSSQILKSKDFFFYFNILPIIEKFQKRSPNSILIWVQKDTYLGRREVWLGWGQNYKFRV